MGYGEIIGGGPTARYTVRLDYGEAIKASTLAALNEQLVKVTNDLSAAQSRLNTAQANAAAERNAVSDAINSFILAGGTGNLSDVAVQAALQFLEQTKKAVIAAERLVVPERLKVDALTIAKAQIVEYIARWNAAVTIQTKDCWCTDYTESGAGYVATIDIDGESGLTLLAPGCRAWQGGDGTISVARKAEAIAQLNARLLRAEEEVIAADSHLAVCIEAENTDKAAVTAAQAAYKAAPDALKAERAQELQSAMELWHASMAKTSAAQVRRGRAQNRVDAVSWQLADWEAKPASETPFAGDGVMFATDVMSPEQYYWNLAAMPAWQKFKPTYRWGTLTALDKDANLASVTLNNATSSQQSLGINQTSTLTNIPVVYMTCNARAFEVNDRVVVQFLGQDWANPRVIGFLDNPRPCLQYTASYYVIGYGPLSSGNNHLFDIIEQDKDEPWGNFTTVTPVAPWKFIQWSDGATSLTRNDGTATENISRTARYTLAPPFDYEYQFVFYWKSFEDSSTPGIKQGQLAVAGQIVFKTNVIGATVISPGVIPVGETIVWSGETTYSSQDDAALAIQEAFPGSEEVVSPTGPIYLPGYAAAGSATVILKYGTSDNEYTVNGSKTSETFPGGRIVGITTTSPDFVPGNFYTAKITYTATTWSAVYA